MSYIDKVVSVLTLGAKSIDIEYSATKLNQYSSWTTAGGKWYDDQTILEDIIFHNFYVKCR